MTKLLPIFLIVLISACASPEKTTKETVVPQDSTTVQDIPKKPNNGSAVPDTKVIERYIEPPDLTTYRNLTSLKPEVVMLYETFVQDPPDYDRIWSIRLRLAQAYEYEKGKESGETAGLINNIRKALDSDLEQRGKDGPWNLAQISARIKNIEGVFGSAIKKAWSERK